jgi:hypothetical protein
MADACVGGDSEEATTFIPANAWNRHCLDCERFSSLRRWRVFGPGYIVTSESGDEPGKSSNLRWRMGGVVSLVRAARIMLKLTGAFEKMSSGDFVGAHNRTLEIYELYGIKYKKRQVLLDVNLLHAYLCSKINLYDTAIDAAKVCTCQIERDYRLNAEEKRYLMLYLSGIIYRVQQHSKQDWGMPVIARGDPGKFDMDIIRTRIKKKFVVNMDFWTAV